MKKIISVVLTMLVAAVNAQAQGLQYRIDLKTSDNVSFMTVTTMLVGQKGIVTQKDGTGSFNFTVEPKDVKADGTVNATATFESTKGGRDEKGHFPLNLKHGESKELFANSALTATVTLQK